MKNTLRLFAALLCVCLPAFLKAQEVIYSQYDKFDNRTSEYNVVGMTGGYLYTYINSPDGARLDAFDGSMTKIATVLLDFFPERIYEARFFSYPDKIIVLYQALESNKVVQYAALLDEKGRLKNKPVELGKAKTGIFGATRTYFSSSVSEDKKTIFIYSASDRGSHTELEGKWLDDNLTIVKRSKASFKTDNNIQHGEVNVGNDGTVYMAAYTPVGTENYADQFWILLLQPGAAKFDVKELLLGDKFAANGYMKLDNVNGHVYFGGFYSNRKSGSFDGVIYADYEMGTGTYVNRRLIPFDAALLEAAAGNRRQSRGFDNNQVRQIVVRKDGGFVLLSEVQFVSARSNYMPGMAYYSYYSPLVSTMVHEYHYNDIMALCYNSAGVRQWASYIPKNQYSQEDGGAFSSFAFVNTGGTLAFLYNDFNMSSSRIQMATIEPDGTTEMHSFTAEGNDNPDWLPRSGKQIAARELVVPCFRKRQICFSKVIL